MPCAYFDHFLQWKSLNEHCVICDQPIVLPAATLSEKGCATINRASEERADTINAVPGQQVHQDCRRKYCNPQQIARDIKQGQQEIKPSTSESTGGHTLRSTEKQFNFKTDCFFCGEPAIFGKKRKSYDVLPVKGNMS